MRIAEWIIENLDQYGNSLVPNNLVRLYPIEELEDEIKRMAGYDVMIEKRMIDKLDFNHNTNKRHKPKKEPLYIVHKTGKKEYGNQK